MKNKKILSFILSFALILNALPFVTVYAEDAAFEPIDTTEVSDTVESMVGGKSEIPYGLNSAVAYLAAGYSSLEMLSGDEAKAAGVPDGYEGSVVKLTNGGGSTGLVIDVTDRGYDLGWVNKITFRVYCPDNVKQVRIAGDAANTWRLQKDPSAKNEWIDVVWEPDLTTMDDGNGCLKPFNLLFRHVANQETTVYIDSVTFEIDESRERWYAYRDEIPYCDNAGGVTGYGGTKKLMSKEQAVEAGVPEEYEGYVLSLTNSGAANSSFFLDLRQSVCKNVKISDVESLTFRVYVPSEVYEARIRTVENGAWQVQKAISSSGEWTDIVVTDMSKFIDDGNGYFSPFVFAFRGSSGNPMVYFDGVTVKLKEVETEPETSVATTEATEAPTEAPTEPEIETVDPEIAKAEIPFTAEDSNYSKYGYSDMKVYATSNAAKAGIPEGYTGDYVMQLTRKTNLSITLDLRQTVCKDIKIEDVESISFKVWIPTKMDLRIKTLSPISEGEWAYIKSFSGGSWHTITITDMATFVDDGNGYFSPFAFTFRDNTNASTDYTVYFDGITVKIKDPEPVKTHYTFEEGMGKEEIPYGAKASLGMSYGYSNFMMMDETQAVAAGVPEGYSGWVLALGSNGGNISIGLDLTNVATRDIEKVSFRVWCPTGTKQHATEGGVRLSGKTASTWNMLASPSAIGEWIDIVLEKDSYATFDFDGDGYCDPMNFVFRGATSTAYIDSITVKLRDPDTVPPVITYNGETVIDTREGRDFVLDISAHDDYYDVDVELEYIWSEGALDNEGKPVQGTHTCTVRATDEAGNSSEIVLTVNVGERDTEAPSINWMPEEIYAMAGMLPDFDIIVADNIDTLDATLTWSEGALDVRGRLTAGEHTLTISAVDLTGNKTEHAIAVHVLATRPVVGELIQDN